MSATRRVAWTTTAVLALSGLVGTAGCAGGSASHGSAAGGGGPTRAAIPGRVSEKSAAAATLGVLQGHGGAQGGARDSIAAQTVPPVRSAVIKTATLAMRVPHREFGQAMDAASHIALRYGGFVSRSSASGTQIHEGRLVMRVPEARFNAARQAVERLGHVTSESVAGQDVTQQFVNLNARLGNLTTQERALRRLMQQTQTVSDTIRVQGVLQGVELQSEEIQGELIYLRNRTEMSTIAIAVHEAGARPTPPAHASALWNAGERSLHTATAVVSGVIVGAGFVIPVAILALLAVLIGRLAAPWAAPLATRRRGATGAPGDDT
jgi:Domain of unknown function (DUF4349)